MSDNSENKYTKWLKANTERLVDCFELIKHHSTPNKPYGRGNVLGSVSSSLMRIGYINVALKNYSKALGAFYQMARFDSLVFEKYYEGADINIELLCPGNWQELCLSLITQNEEIINRFNTVYKRAVFDEKVNKKIWHSVYIGQLLSLLIEGNISAAREYISVTRCPKLDTRFKGTYEILDALANKDENMIVESITNAGQFWGNYMKRQQRQQYEVESIAFLFGAGFHYLGEKLLGKKIELSIPEVPSEMMGVIPYEPYPIPDYAFL